METPLKVFRQARGLVCGTVAKEIGIDPSHYRRIEIGEVCPSAAIAKRISEYFGGAVTRDQILFPEEYLSKPARSKAVAQLQEAS